MFMYILNAIGRHGDGEWMPFHLDENGNHRDMSGLMIMPFDEVKQMSSVELTAWLETRNMVPVHLGSL